MNFVQNSDNCDYFEINCFYENITKSLTFFCFGFNYHGCRITIKCMLFFGNHLYKTGKNTWRFNFIDFYCTT